MHGATIRFITAAVLLIKNTQVSSHFYHPVSLAERYLFSCHTSCFPQSFDFVSTLISKDWSPLVYSHAVSLFSFHLSETRLRPSIHRFSPTVSAEVRPVVIFYIFVFPYRVLCTPPALHHNIIERLDPM